MAMFHDVSMAVPMLGFVISGTLAALAIGGGIAASLWGASRQERAADKARRQQATQLKFEQDLTLKLLEEGRPLREAQQLAAVESINLLRSDVTQDPGTSSEFLRTERAGISRIMSNLATFGLTDSSSSRSAVGEFSADLLASDTARLTGERFRLAGLGTDLTSQGVGVAGLTGASSRSLSNATLTAGTASAIGPGSLGELAFKYGLDRLSSGAFTSSSGSLSGSPTGVSTYGATPATSSGFTGPFDLTGGG